MKEEYAGSCRARSVGDKATRLQEPERAGMALARCSQRRSPWQSEVWYGNKMPADGARCQSNPTTRLALPPPRGHQHLEACLAGPGIRLHRYRSLRLAEGHLLAGLHVQRAGWG